MSKYTEKKQTAMASKVSSKRKRKGVTSEESKGKKKKKMSNKLVKPRKLRLLGCDDNINHLTCTHPPIPHYESPTNDASSSTVGVTKSAMERAKEVYDNLDSLKIPCFLKKMSRSHVTLGFWLGIPKKFCVQCLPKHDETVALHAGDNGQEYDTNYLANRCGLSGGWRGFSLAHELVEEDVLVFEEVEPCKLKVHIMRAKSSAEIDGATSLLKLKLHAEPQIIEDELVNIEEETGSDKSLELVAAPSENDENEDIGELVHPCDSSSETMDGITFSESVATFKDFHIYVNSSMIDAKIPLHHREKYYELCRSQNKFLHENVHGLNKTLTAGMISETINIADALKAANSSTDVSHLRGWDTTLEAFEGLGMAVGFLRARIDKLLTLPRQLEAQIELKRKERAEAIHELRMLVEKVPDLKKMIEKLSGELDSLVAKKEEVAAAPW